MTQTEILVYGSGWSLFCAAAGWFANDWLSRRRERAQRQRDLIHFLSVWRSETERLSPSDTQGISRVYVAKVHDLHGHVSIVRRDIWRKHRFDALAEPLKCVGGEDFIATTPDPRDVVCGKIDRLKAFLGAEK